MNLDNQESKLAKKNQIISSKFIAPRSFDNMSDREKSLVYSQCYEENIQLKKNIKEMNNLIKQLTTKIKRIESDYNKLKEKNQYNFQQQKLSLPQLTDTKALELLLEEKQAEISKLRERIDFYSSKNLTAQLNQQIQLKEEHNQQLTSLVEQLRNQIIKQEGQMKVMQEMFNTGGKASTAEIQLQAQQERNLQMQAFNARLDELQRTMESQQKMISLYKAQIEKSDEQVHKERQLKVSLEKQIRVMELSVRSAKDMQQEIEELKNEKKGLEARLEDLCNAPLVGKLQDRTELQLKLKQLESERIQIKTENKSFQEQLAKAELELKQIKKELSTTMFDLQSKKEENIQIKTRLEERDKQLAPFKDLDQNEDEFLKALGTLKWQGEEPAWTKLQFLERDNLEPQNTQSLLREIEKLRLEKGELAAQLEKAHTLLATQQEISQEETQIQQKEIQKLQLQLQSALNQVRELSYKCDKQAHQFPMQSQGNLRDESEFDDSEQTILEITSDEQNQYFNVFDFWIQEANLESQQIFQIIGIDTSQIKGNQSEDELLKTFLTVDFFNHQTQHSSIVMGKLAKYNLQVSFKIQINSVFVYYMQTGFIKLEVYWSKGKKTVLLASCNVSLRELLQKNQIAQNNQKRIVNGQAMLIHQQNNSVIGVISYKMRIRRPIFQQLQLIMSNQEVLQSEMFPQNLDILQLQASQKRKLILILDNGSGLNKKYNSFVFFNFNNQDYCTDTQQGSDPKWDFRTTTDIFYNEEMAMKLQNTIIEFVVFDDSVPLILDSSQQKQEDDCIGTAKVSLQQLVQNEIIDKELEIKGNKGQKIGLIHFKAFWHQGVQLNVQKPQYSEQLISKSWEQDIINKISLSINQKQLGTKQAFLLFDVDNDSVISQNDFNQCVKFALNLQKSITSEELDLFYQKLPQPFNYDNFNAIFGNYNNFQ